MIESTEAWDCDGVSIQAKDPSLMGVVGMGKFPIRLLITSKSGYIALDESQ